MPDVVNEITGEIVAEEEYTPEGVERAESRAAQSDNLTVDYAPGGTSDGTMRSVTEYAGGGKTGYSKIGMYEKGGKVEKTTSEKAVDAASLAATVMFPKASASAKIAKKLLKSDKVRKVAKTVAEEAALSLLPPPTGSLLRTAKLAKKVYKSKKAKDKKKK